MRFPFLRSRRAASEYEHGAAHILSSRPSPSNSWLRKNSATTISILVAALAAGGSIWQAHLTQDSLAITRQQIKLSEEQFRQQLKQQAEDSVKSELQAQKQYQLAKDAIETTRQNASSAATAATATIRSANLASEGLELSNRPWLTARPEVSSLNFGELGVFVTLKVYLRNIGHTPATHVQTIAALHVGWIDLESSRSSLCGTVEPYPQNPQYKEFLARSRHGSLGPDEKGGYTIFPGDEVESEVSVFTGRLEVQEYLSKLEQLSRDYGYRQNGVIPTVIGCANYYSEFNHAQHQSGFAYAVEDKNAKDDSGRVGLGPIPTPPQQVPNISDLLLIRSGLYNGFSAY